ncbi:Subtilisin-like protease [Rhynchospora pubera]|uniref:Subtilisin-like protease n=1 Tax=Rhynchospora pubera TaxID=906938 RepID=A0AAV8GW90_9POAL|nr:Subtilisin-like protease [Rhynchospora pubera]
MACPHVAGAAAFVKSAHRGWSPSMIRSALMTTALINNNIGKPLTTSLGANANYHDTGAGEISPLRALSPGLEKIIRKISGTNFSCSSSNPSPDLISTINYPSISIPRLGKNNPATVTRTLTNVGPHNSTYAATIDAPAGVSVKVSPEKLVFGTRWLKASYQISFSESGAPKGYSYGSVTWSDGAHSVRTGFAVNVL